MAHISEQVKHIGDAVVIPGGLIGIMSHYMPLLNQVLTFCVLLTSLVWGVYRIFDMIEVRKRRREQRSKEL